MSVLSFVVPVPAGGDGPIVDVSALSGPKTVLLSGTFDGTYVLLGSQNGVKFVPVAQFDSGSGPAGIEQTVPGALRFVRMRSLASAIGAVTCGVSGISGEGTNHFAVVASLGAGFTGLTPPVDTFAPTGLEQDICFLCEGQFRGQVVVLGSMDGLAYEPVGAFRVDTVPAGFGGVYELEPLVTLDKVRFIRLNVDGVTDGPTTVTVGGFVPSGSAPPFPTPVADWTGVRYIFLDGDNGDDANVGYIDAPAGTVFTPAQAAAVAVKTTHRVDEIRPPVGAGRSVVVLFKNRAGNATYDLLTPGDGLGQEDRSACTGYGMMISRGSTDLTNSVADRIALGFVTAIPGPNGDGSFTVAAVIPPTSSVGTGFELTGAALPDGWILRRYRLRFETVASGTFYAPVQWGEPSDTPDPTLVFSTLVTGTVVPGDKCWIEEAGVSLHDFVECANTAKANEQSGVLRTYALTVRGGSFVVGTVDAGGSSDYSYCGADPGSGATLSNSPNGGTIRWTTSVSDETNALVTFSAFGMWATSNSAIQCDTLVAQASTLADSSSPPSFLTVINARKIFLSDDAFQNLFLLGGVDGAQLTASLVGQVQINAGGRTQVTSNREIPYWQVGIAMAPESPATDAEPAAYELADNAAFWGAEPPTPGYTFFPGQYSVWMDMDTLHPGAGTELHFDRANILNNFVPVSYTSLSTTGFEIEGGQKFVCHRSGVGYPGDVLLCPRGVVMRQAADPTGGATGDVGTLVGYSLSSSGRFDLAVAQTPGEIVPTGVTLTNWVQGGASFPDAGWAVVSADEYVVVRLDPGSATPDFGAVVYLSAVAGTCITASPTPSVAVGRSAPTGPLTGTGNTFVLRFNADNDLNAPPVASWDPTLVRFIFLDGDGGNDALPGYIDAPAGTVFTAPQAAAVAVRSSSRINQIRPPVGAGRSVVVLFKPRGGSASYNDEDRSACAGYKLMVSRGSDLTNSAADWAAMGSITVVPGPNVDGSFTVAATIAPTADHGLGLQLTGAALPGANILRGYRLRIIHGASTLYAPIQWGDLADVPDPTILYTATLGAGTVDPGDFVFIEAPGAIVGTFVEAADASDTGTAGGALRTYGLRVLASAALGSVVAGVEGHYGYFCVGGGSGPATISSRGQGDVVGDVTIFTEAGAFVGGNIAPGIWGPSNTQIDLGVGSLTLNNSTLADSMIPGDVESFLTARSATLVATALQFVSITSTGGNGTVMRACLLGSVDWTFAVRTEVASCRCVPVWGFPVLTVHKTTVGGDAASPGFELSDVAAFWGAYPDTPSFDFAEGSYTVYLERTNAVGPGSGIKVESEVITGGIQVSWDSLDKTGFEIVGRQKFVVHKDGQGYPNGILPCPRSEIMSMVTTHPDGTQFDVGTSVGTSLVTPGEFDVASAALGGVMPTGALAATCVVNLAFNPAIVAIDGYLVLKMVDGGTPPVAGDLLFLSGATLGVFTIVDPRPLGICVILGRGVSIGPQGDQWYAVRWNPNNEAIVPGE